MISSYINDYFSSQGFTDAASFPPWWNFCGGEVREGTRLFTHLVSALIADTNGWGLIPWWFLRTEWYASHDPRADIDMLDTFTWWPHRSNRMRNYGLFVLVPVEIMGWHEIAFPTIIISGFRFGQRP